MCSLRDEYLERAAMNEKLAHSSRLFRSIYLDLAQRWRDDAARWTQRSQSPAN
jgi:hypothetical protein